MKTKSHISPERIRRDFQSRFNPISGLSPEGLALQLDEFRNGNLRRVAQTWDVIERRDDVLQGVASKRKKAIARHQWEVRTIDDSPEAAQHKQALDHFYNHITFTNAIDENQTGSMSLGIEQMADAIGKRYAVHEIVWNPNGQGGLTATLRFVPLWFFENRTGRLRYLDKPAAIDGIPMKPGQWLVTVGEGIMESCSVAYMYKHLPLRDWLIYCERNGMPGVRGVTDALPGSREWELAREAVEAFGAEFHALMNRGTEIEAIDLSARGSLPYPALVDRMDRAMIALWRGADLSTFSSAGGVGASVQKEETELLEQHDARMISETLNTQVDRHVIRHLFGTETPRAYFTLKTSTQQDLLQYLRIYRELWEMGVPIAISDLHERFGVPMPTSKEPTLAKS